MWANCRELHIVSFWPRFYCDDITALADLITVGPDRAQEIWQTVLTHIEAKNEALKQKLDTSEFISYMRDNQ